MTSCDPRDDDPIVNVKSTRDAMARIRGSLRDENHRLMKERDEALERAHEAEKEVLVLKEVVRHLHVERWLLVIALLAVAACMAIWGVSTI